MNQEDAIRKAMACLRLAKSSNQAEAALAAAKAQEIMERFKLNIDDLDFDANQVKENNEPIKDFNDDPLENTGDADRKWSLRLASTVARNNLCRVYYSNMGSCEERNKSYRISIVGRPSDVSTVRYIYSYLKGEVARLMNENCKGNSRSYKVNYCFGVVDAIDAKLHEQKNKTQSEVKAEHANNPLALVRVNNAIARMEKQDAEVAVWMKSNLHLRKSSGSGMPNSATRMTARAHGQRDGKNVRFTSAKAGLGRGVAGQLS